jgi:Ca2+-binding EF-hand superfamily protein
MHAVFCCTGKGDISVRSVKHALQKFSEEVVPLTLFQIHTIVSVAPVDNLGSVKYAQMVPVVEKTVKAITDMQHMKTRFYVIEELAQSEMLNELSQHDPEDLRKLLKDAFERADTDNSGTLTGEMHEQSSWHLPNSSSESQQRHV